MASPPGLAYTRLNTRMPCPGTRHRRHRTHHPQASRAVTHPIVDWYNQRGILVSANATRAAEEVGHGSS
jgi:hypothetical protein